MNELCQLAGKVALVTGCKRGIGRAMAEALAEAGADVIGVSASMEASGSDVERVVKALGRNFYAYQYDVGDRDALYAFISRVKEAHTEIDSLVIHAVTILREPRADNSE